MCVGGVLCEARVDVDGILGWRKACISLLPLCLHTTQEGGTQRRDSPGQTASWENSNNSVFKQSKLNEGVYTKGGDEGPPHAGQVGGGVVERNPGPPCRDHAHG